MSVLLPAPLEPISPKISPCETVSETSATATNSPKRRVSARVTIAGSELFRLASGILSAAYRDARSARRGALSDQPVELDAEPPQHLVIAEVAELRILALEVDGGRAAPQA